MKQKESSDKSKGKKEIVWDEMTNTEPKPKKNLTTLSEGEQEELREEARERFNRFVGCGG